MRKFTRCIIAEVPPQLGPAGAVAGSVIPPAGLNWHCRHTKDLHQWVSTHIFFLIMKS